MKSNYNDALRMLGLPELPDCEECGLQIRRNMESPYNVLGEDADGNATITRFCSIDCCQKWLNRKADSA